MKVSLIPCLDVFLCNKLTENMYFGLFSHTKTNV